MNSVVEGNVKKFNDAQEMWKPYYVRIIGRSLNIYTNLSNDKPRGSSINDVLYCTLEKPDENNLILHRGDIPYYKVRLNGDRGIINKLYEALVNLVRGKNWDDDITEDDKSETEHMGDPTPLSKGGTKKRSSRKKSRKKSRRRVSRRSNKRIVSRKSVKRSKRSRRIRRR
tara:strand:+ start:11 stop:520 length:510 start_codon:yes stop_codon:yes gene_type:complete